MKNGIVRGQRMSDGWGNSKVNPTQAIKAKIELGKFKKPKGVSFGHKANLARKKSEGQLDQEFYWVLIDYRNGNEQIKRTTMNHGEAWKRNKALEGTGFAWAKIDR